MVKKKISGQTLAIIILTILLLLAVAFGGVYAFYSTSTNKVTGKVVMANLKIEFNTNNGVGGSGSSEILISNTNPVIPGQGLENTPLTITNSSNTPIYLAVVYSVGGEEKDTGEAIVDDLDGGKVLDIGAGVGDSIWFDCVFKSDESSDGEPVSFRCFVTPYEQTDETIVVVEENKLKLHEQMGDNFQNSLISFKFQAYAIGSRTDSLIALLNGIENKQDRCNIIMGAIFTAFENKITI